MPLPRHVQSLPPHPLAILDHLLVEVEVFEEPKSARKILINITNMEVQLLPQNFYFRPTEPTAGGESIQTAMLPCHNRSSYTRYSLSPALSLVYSPWPARAPALLRT